MIEKGTGAVACWLIECGAVKEEEQELYCYAVYSFLLSVSPLLLAAVFGLCLGCLKQSIVIVIPFMVIRKFSGGYHAKRLRTCLLCSGFLLLLCILFSRAAVCDRRLWMIAILSGISLWVCSPLENENRILDSEEKSRYKRITAVFTAGFLLLGILLHFVGFHSYSVCVFTGIILSAGLQIPAILGKYIRQESIRSR